MEQVFKLTDFNIYNKKNSSENSSDDETAANNDTPEFLIQMFGINEKGEQCSILCTDFKPFFYAKVDDNWTIHTKTQFVDFIKRRVGVYYAKSINECKIIKRKKLYGFDGGKEHKFILLTFNNIQAFNKVKNLWFDQERKLLVDGVNFKGSNVYLYEANIPPLLRFFHIKDISPSGWVALPNKHTIVVKHDKKTNCQHEFIINHKFVIPLNSKETGVPYKICSFDIEASSSHGDFPIPIKSYKKLAIDIVEYFENIASDISSEQCKSMLRKIMLTAFSHATKEEKINEIDIVYPKLPPFGPPPKSKNEIEIIIQKWLLTLVRDNKNDAFNNQMTIEKMFESMNAAEDEEENNGYGVYGGNGEDGEDDEDSGYGASYIPYANKKPRPVIAKNATIVDIMCDKKFDRDAKLLELNISLNTYFPKLEGDKVTFIGTTFLTSGQKEPYLSHCVVLNSCSPVPVDNSVIETYDTERALLLAWRNLIQKENPDIIIGYNIFGFDYQFMFHRAEENGCVEEFLKLSKNKDEICGKYDQQLNKYQIEENHTKVASGQHDLKYINMPGRIQIDLLNFFRKEENLVSYKLDSVAGHFIGDYIKKLDYNEEINHSATASTTNMYTTIQSTNLTGLLTGSYIHFEEIGHTTDYYSGGDKFIVYSVDKSNGTFVVKGKIEPDMSKKVRWCLAKDDVTPKDIFRMTNGSADDRAVIAKYCIQDCNLVHYLMNKVDILTGFIEMSKLCSVPISFLVLRGQGIKLTSYVAKKCREKRTLMPTIEKMESADGFEGAMVLDPKCDLYLDNPVACVDYASLYPSSMISENLSHDSKVWTREYDLNDELIEETGDQNDTGEFIYDNLPGYEYVNVTYDAFKYVRKTPAGAAEKIKCGYKICRFVQFPEGSRAIMPSILEELLVARKTTRKLIPMEKDEFMKNVLDKRQLAYKLTANSLYGQCGAKTSTFYEKDVAASTTATGRMLLTYAKKLIEETYGNKICDTANYGQVLTKAEYIYGDSVARYTPVYVKVNETFDICTIEQLAKKYGGGLWTRCLEEGKQEKEVCELNGVYSWSDKGWTRLFRIIRHALAPHKKMMRIMTHHGLVDVTDDHSLIRSNGQEVSPKDVAIGTELLHNRIPTETYADYIKNNNNPDYDISGITDHLLLANYCAKKQSCGHNIILSKVSAIMAATKSNRFHRASSGNLSIKCTTEPYNNSHNEIQSIELLSSYEGYVYDLTTENHHFAAGIGNMIVHNTDSVFFTFNLQALNGELIRGKKALEITIELAQEAGHLASSFLKAPHDLEYEKTFMPFCLLSKKRYIGMLYEHDANKGKRKEMGIVLKRRDNAPIVKDIYGGIIDILMKQQDIQKAADFLKACLKNIVDEKCPMDKLIITKSLRSGYKKPKQIAHKVLADRIMSRDPGNKPTSGDRIAYIYVHNANKKALQGDKIETPTYIKENNLKIDYSHYITNQIMNPVQQVFALVLEKMWIMQNKKAKITKFKLEIKTLKDKTEPSKFEEKLDDLKNKEVKALLFDEFLRETNNQKNKNQPLTKYFKQM